MKKKDRFQKTESFKLKNDKERLLVNAFLHAKNKEEMADLLRDLLTIAEIEEFANRIEIARLLLEGESYLPIAKKTGVSTTTVTRVAHWLYKGCGGYWNTFKKILSK